MDPNEILKQLGIDLIKDADYLVPVEKSIEFSFGAKDPESKDGNVLKGWIEDLDGNVLKASKNEPEEEFILAGIASSTIKDRHGDVMLPSALIEMEKSANAGLTMFLNHKYEVPEDVAGSVRKASIKSTGTDEDGNPIYDLDYQFRIDKTNGRAIQSFKSIHGGTKLGLSIGARIPEGGAIRNKKTGRLLIAHVDLLETSIVGVPANPRSWVEAAVKAYKANSEPAPYVVRSIEVDELKVAEGTGEPNVGVEVPEGTTATLEVFEDGSSEVTVTEGQTMVIGEAGEELTITQSSTPTQEAPQSEPGAEGEVATEEVVAAAETPEVLPDLGKATSTELLDALLKAQSALSETSMQLIEAQAALRKAEQRADSLQRERDMVAQGSRDLALDVAQIIQRLGNLPVGQRASFRRIQQDFNDGLESAKDIYGEEFVTTLRSFQK